VKALVHHGLCQEEHPLAAIDPAGEIPLVCGLPRSHAGVHEDWRAVILAQQVKLARAVEVLVAIEWHEDLGDCPSCGAEKRHGHDATCQLDAALREAGVR
jgi:hypothetical protein